jgi:hypothetical protein
VSRSDSRTLRLGRLESLSALAGGLTHEMSNLAASVLMLVQLLEPSCGEAASRQVLVSLEELAQRLQHAGRQLHWLARGVAGEPMMYQPQYLLSDLQKLARAAFPASVALVTRYPPDLWPLAGDPLVVFQLLLALVLEAHAQLPDGGTMVLAARNEVLDGAGWSGAGSAAATAGPGRYVVLEALAEAAGAEGAGSAPAACAGGRRRPGPGGGATTRARRRRAAAEARRAAIAAGGFTAPLPRGMAARGRRAYLPAADPVRYR